ncbi:MAG: type II toxin-antitoxin system prevent-host-death family antitoxin [Armatimonadota bacterium]
MRLVSTAELKNRTNEVLRTALAGDPVVVTRHGRPVASLLRLEEGDLASLAPAAGPGDPRAVGRTAARRTPRAGRMERSPTLGPYHYAAFPQPFGTFFVAYGPDGPAFARIAPTAVAFERDALRYLGAPVHRAPPPAWLTTAVGAAVRRGDAFRGPVDLRRLGPFEEEVLARLRRIPAGAVRTYQEIARAVGQPGAARAVGAACARNPLPLLIPCHRVVRTDGGLGGYSLRGGIALKRRLLEAEGALPTLLP